MTINIPCWTTSKEEADKLVDNLSEGCYEYGKDESKEKMLDVFYKTKALKNYVGIMQGRIELLNARIAEFEAERERVFDLVRELRTYCIFANWDNPDTEDDFNEFDVEVCKWLSKYMEREE